MHPINIGLIFISGLNVGLAFLIWSRNFKNKINISFSLGLFFVAIWTLGIAMFRESQTESVALVWTWVQNFSGSLIVIPFFLFSLYFPYQNRVLKLWQWILILISIIIIFLVVVVSNVWIKDIRLIPHDNDYSINFWGILYFNIHFYFYLVLAFWNLLKKYKDSQGFTRKQLRYLTISSGIIALFGGIFGAFIPLIMLSTAGPYWVGPYFSLPLVVYLSWFISKKEIKC